MASVNEQALSDDAEKMAMRFLLSESQLREIRLKAQVVRAMNSPPLQYSPVDQQMRAVSHQVKATLDVDVVLSGPQACGKTTMAYLLRTLFAEMGLGDAVIVDRADGTTWVHAGANPRAAKKHKKGGA